MFLLIVIVFLLSDQYSTVAVNTCNDECLSKTYCISKDGTSVCSKDNLFSAVFTMDQVDDELYFSLTLTEYQIVTNETHHHFELILSSGSSTTTYYCKLHAQEPRSFVFQNNNQLAAGSSQYINNDLQCNWKATKSSRIWPFNWKADYKHIIASKHVSLTLKYNDLNYGSRSVVLANDSSELPFYRLQSLKCCNKVRESDKFIFTFHRKDDHINYYFQLFHSSSADDILISFTNPNGLKLVFTCNREKYSLTSLIQEGMFVTSVRELFNARVDDSSCSWITPLCLSYDTNQLELLGGSFDLKVTSDNVVLYAERNVQFERIAEVSPSSGQSSLTPLTFITLISTYYLQLILSKVLGS